MASDRPWHEPGRWFTSPHIWETEMVQQRPAMPRRVHVVDATLKEGEETPGVVFTWEDRLEIAQRLQDVGVEAVDLPSLQDPQEQKSLVERFRQGGVTKTHFIQRCRRRPPYENKAWRDLVARAVDLGVEEVRIFMGFNTLDLWNDFTEAVSKQQIVDMIRESVQFAKACGAPEVTLGWASTTRTQLQTACLFARAAAEAGACRVRIQDSRGVGAPSSIRFLAAQMKAAIGEASVLYHGHNDLGMATANTLAAVEGGADWIDVTVNGLGDRAGNASLEEVVVGLELLYRVETGIKLDHLYSLSQRVAALSGVSPQPNKAVVGRNAFLEEAAAHFLGSVQEEKEGRPESSLPYVPELVGQRRRLVIGSTTLSHYMLGGGVIEYKFKEWGYPCTSEIIDKVRKVAMPQIQEKGFLSEEEFKELCRGVVNA